MSTCRRPSRSVDLGVPFQVVAIGTSAGGLAALRELCAAFPANLPAAILVVMHVSPHRESSLAHLLAAACVLPVEEACPGRRLAPGRITVAAPDRHLIVTACGELEMPCSERVNFSRPAIDPLFVSVAQLSQQKATAVLLTGSGSDGTAGAAHIKANGGTVFAQDPAGCVAREMPRSAIHGGFVDHVLPLAQLGPALVAHVRANER
jgi:two-component system chemotaxis response regulator CheB